MQIENGLRLNILNSLIRSAFAYLKSGHDQSLTRQIFVGKVNTQLNHLSKYLCEFVNYSDDNHKNIDRQIFDICAHAVTNFFEANSVEEHEDAVSDAVDKYIFLLESYETKQKEVLDEKYH